MLTFMRICKKKKLDEKYIYFKIFLEELFIITFDLDKYFFPSFGRGPICYSTNQVFQTTSCVRTELL